jgi:hypothetical protein
MENIIINKGILNSLKEKYTIKLYMKGGRISMKGLFAIILAWLTTIILVAVNIFKNPNAFFVNGTILLGWALFAAQLTWNKSEVFYLYIKRIWFFIKNPDCIWNMQVEYYGEFDRNTFRKIDQLMFDNSVNLKQISLSETRKLYKKDTLSFEISIDEYTGNIRFSIDDLEVSYRRSRNIIEKELGVLLEKLSKCIKEESSQYFLNVSFKEFNPYYGFFLRRLKAQDIQSFNVKFTIENNRIAVSKNSIEINTSSLQSLNRFSKEYLTLSPR